MGLKITSIIIKNPQDVSDDRILNKLFVGDFVPLDPVSFDKCIYPSNDQEIYFGNYKDNLIISTYAFDLVDKFYTNGISKAEAHFIELFPNSEIGAFSLQSTTNYYAWTIIAKGQKIRAKQGDADNGITCDFGNPLPEENDFLKLSFKDKKGDIRYNWPKKDGNAEVVPEDEIGENYVSKIWSRFTGIELFYDELLNETQFRGYWLQAKKNETNSLKDKRNIWQKLFGQSQK